MNERIREPYYSLMYEASQGWNDHLFQVPPELLEKFAELIVKEMCNVFDKRAEPGTGFYEPHEPAELIKQHFGVEE